MLRESSDHRLNHWLGQLKGVLNDAENVLDEFQYQILQKKVMKRCRSTRKKVGYFFSISNPLVLRFEMARKIKGIRERVDDISELRLNSILLHDLKIGRQQCTGGT